MLIFRFSIVTSMGHENGMGNPKKGRKSKIRTLTRNFGELKWNS